MPDILVSNAAARRLLLAGQGLTEDPARRADAGSVYRLIERLGYVQVDTISVIERAHHHILMTRFDGYHSDHLKRGLERDRRLFEHWTHDASIIPARWLPYWRVRFQRYAARGHGPGTWWGKRMGPQSGEVVDHVLDRIRDEGPLRSRDFEHEAAAGESSWWGWKPQKAALEYLWRAGALSVARREGFQKVYDLTERVFPEIDDADHPDDDDHIDWACREAMDRLGVATTGEIARYFNAVGSKDVNAWVKAALARGDVVEVRVETADGSSAYKAIARSDWARRAGSKPAPDRMRPLSPFDPIMRDRRRALRVFGFDYRFEAFVPAPKRQYGYYVLPLLDGESIVGRLDAKHHRDRGEFVVNGVWWEPKSGAARRRSKRLREALAVFCEQIGARTCTLPKQR